MTEFQRDGNGPTSVDVSCGKHWDHLLFPCTFFPPNPRQGSNHFKGCSCSGYGEVFGLCVHWPCSHISNTMSQPSLDTPGSSLLPRHRLQMHLGTSYPSSYSLNVICSLLPPYFCSFSSFLKRFPSGHSGLPNPLKFYLLHQIHPGGSCLMLVPLPQISTPQQACTTGFSNLVHTDLHSFFFFLSFKVEKFQTQSWEK